MTDLPRVVHGYKAVGINRHGFTSMCGDYMKFTPGEIHETLKPPQMGRKGFHGCTHVSRCMELFDACSAPMCNAYGVVEAEFWDPTISNNGSVVASKVRIPKEAKPIWTYNCRMWPLPAPGSREHASLQRCIDRDVARMLLMPAPSLPHPDRVSVLVYPGSPSPSNYFFLYFR